MTGRKAPNAMYDLNYRIPDWPKERVAILDQAFFELFGHHDSSVFEHAELSPIVGAVDGVDVIAAAVLPYDDGYVIQMMYVEPEARCRGYAKAMIRHIRSVFAPIYASLPITTEGAALVKATGMQVVEPISALEADENEMIDCENGSYGIIGE
ncbi:MAG: GNAT family N-acetyltransferase [Fimbriimonas sp.]